MRTYKRERTVPESNYKAIFRNGTTLRFPINPSKPVLRLAQPEIEDVSITAKCLANCPYCYTSALKENPDHDDVVDKINTFYGEELEEEHRPFQIALGGEGEPTMHPDFLEVLESFSQLNIMPNYTTNGMHLTDELIEKTDELCGGVAVSCHPHIEKVWRKAIERLSDTRLYLHIIVGQPGTAGWFWEEWEKSSNSSVKQFVALPYQAAGRGKQIETYLEWDLFFEMFRERKPDNVAIGALFDPFIKARPEAVRGLNLSLYEPEIFSGYRIMDDTFRQLRVSSYDLSPRT